MDKTMKFKILIFLLFLASFLHVSTGDDDEEDVKCKEGSVAERLCQLEVESTEMKVEIRALKSEDAEIRTELDFLSGESLNCRNDIQGLNSTISTLRSDNKTFRSQISALNSASEDMMDEIKSLTAGAEEANREIQTLKTDNQRLFGIIANLTSRLEYLEDLIL